MNTLCIVLAVLIPVAYLAGWALISNQEGAARGGPVKRKMRGGGLVETGARCRRGGAIVGWFRC